MLCGVVEAARDKLCQVERSEMLLSVVERSLSTTDWKLLCGRRFVENISLDFLSKGHNAILKMQGGELALP